MSHRFRSAVDTAGQAVEGRWRRGAAINRSGDGKAQVDETTNEAGEAILRLRGEFDVANAERLGTALGKIAAKRPTRMVIDLSELDFIDVRAAAQIAAARLRLPPQQCAIVLRHPRPIVRMVIELTGLDGPCVIEDGSRPSDSGPR